MTQSAPPSTRELFQIWKQLMDGGTLTTAAQVAGDHPELISPLQQLINDYISYSSHGLEETLTAAHAATEPEPPPVLSDFTVIGSLGQGGMGVVYHVRDALDREFALKLAKKGQLSEAGRSRFLDEAKAMANLDHPHVARIHHYGLVDDLPYFLMRVYPATLKDKMEEYQADPKKAVRLMAAVADGVGHLHSRGYVHRDLKPHNILLDEHGNPAVSDFGLVKGVSDSSSGDSAVVGGSGSAETKPSGAKASRTVVGTVIGTRAYMAPEQAAGLTHLANPRWDVWALGVILHQLLTGQYPRSSEAPQKLLDPNEPDNPAPSTIKPGIDPKLERIVQKCLARDEGERYGDGRQVADCLGRILGMSRRTRWRIPAAIGLIMLGLVIGITWAVAPWRLKDNGSQPSAVKFDDIRQLLAAGETVELVGSSGFPLRGYRMVGTGEQVTPYLAKTSQELVIESSESAHVLLVDSPGIERYRVDAEVLQLQANPSSRVGLIQGLHEVDTTEGMSLVYSSLGFNKHGQSGNFQVAVFRRLLPCAENGYASSVSQLSILPGSLLDGEKVLRSWMKLAAVVRPDKTEWYLNGRLLREVPRPLPASVRKPFEEKVVKLRKPGTLDVAPAGGIGLVVANSSAKFRNVTITPEP